MHIRSLPHLITALLLIPPNSPKAIPQNTLSGAFQGSHQGTNYSEAFFRRQIADGVKPSRVMGWAGGGDGGRGEGGGEELEGGAVEVTEKE